MGSGHQFASVNPATEQTIGVVHQASAQQVKAAVSAAARVLPDWRSTPLRSVPPSSSGWPQISLRDDWDIQGKPTPLELPMHDEMGKMLPEAKIEVDETMRTVDFLAAETVKILAPTDLELDPALWPSKQNLVLRQPVGVMGVIKPGITRWRFRPGPWRRPC